MLLMSFVPVMAVTAMTAMKKPVTTMINIADRLRLIQSSRIQQALSPILSRTALAVSIPSTSDLL